MTNIGGIIGALGSVGSGLRTQTIQSQVALNQILSGTCLPQHSHVRVPGLVSGQGTTGSALHVYYLPDVMSYYTLVHLTIDGVQQTLKTEEYKRLLSIGFKKLEEEKQFKNDFDSMLGEENVNK